MIYDDIRYKIVEVCFSYGKTIYYLLLTARVGTILMKCTRTNKAS